MFEDIIKKFILFSETMYTDVGKKLKSLVKFWFWGSTALFIILAVILFLLSFFVAINEEDIYYFFLYFFSSLVALIFGPLLSWMNYLFLYGFGELIDKTIEIHTCQCETKRCLEETKKLIQKQNDKQTENE